MKKYYKGNVERLRINNLTISKYYPHVEQERIVISRDVLFYKTRLGVIMRFEDKCPIPTYTETLGYMEKHLNGSSPRGEYNSGTYVAEDSLKPIEMTREEEKRLIKLRREKN